MGIEFIPYHDWVVVEPELVRETEGGIVLPETVEPEFQTRVGLVRGVGPGPLLESGVRSEPQSRVGERVEYYSYNAKRGKIGGKEVDVIRDGNVIGRYGV